MEKKQEKRATRRFKCPGTARIDAPGSHAGQPGTVRDLSLGGCLLELAKAKDFAHGAPIELTINSRGRNFRVRGTVTPRSTNLLIGICFHTMTDRSRLELQELIETLGGDPAARIPEPPQTAAEGLLALAHE